MYINRLTVKRLISRLLDDKGQDLVEYVLILGLLALATVAGSGTVRASINSAVSSVAAAVSANT
jgi:Flp pilus assembly pilin Flp